MEKNSKDNIMTPEQKIKQLILTKQKVWNEEFLKGVEITSENIDEIFDTESEGWALQDSKNEVREGDVETGLDSPGSRHYESKEVAAKCADGSWVGWTYWFGGGKHGEPEAIDWMDEAYALDCVEEEKMVVVRTFSKG